MVPYLPPELIDCIISKLAAEDAIEALAACSLVSRVWNALAQPHQFRRLCYSFKRILNTARPDGPGVEESDPKNRTWHSFIHFFESSPHISELVNLLVLSLSRDVQYSGSIDREKYRRDLQDVVAILPLFPNLTSIDIASYILNFPHNLLDYRAFLPQRVKNVRIGGHWAKYYDDIEPQQLLWLMHPFSASSEITLTRFFFQLPSVIASTHAFPNFSVLDSLSLRDNFNTDLFLSTLQSLSGCFPALRRLEIGFITLRGQRKAWDIVNTFSGQLIYLGLQRSKNIDEDDIPSSHDWELPPLPHLTTLRFISSRRYWDYPRISRAWEHALLTVHPSRLPSLSNIVFEHVELTDIRLESVPKEELHRVERRLLDIPGLREVRFEERAQQEWRGSRECPFEVELFVKAFPELHARNLLRVK